MNQFFSKPISKAVIDILLVAGLFISNPSSIDSANSASWGSFHCISSMVWYALMIVHIWQHWRMTKALAKWNVMRRNIITTLIAIFFMLMTVSIVLFIFGTGHIAVHIHHAVAHFFWFVIIIHAVQKAKRFVYLFKKKEQKKVIR